MLKLIFCARRLPHLSREAFQRYWHETHGPLVRRHATVLRIRRYVQVHTLTHPVQDGAPREPRRPRGLRRRRRALVGRRRRPRGGHRRPAGRAASLELLEDERRFIDLARSPVFVGEEKVVVG